MYTLFITRGYPSDKYKMNGIFEFDQAKALVNNNCKVVYAAVDLRSIRRWRKWGLEKKEIDGIPMYILNLPIGNIPLRFRRFISEQGIKYLYKKIILDHKKPALIHAHFTENGYLGAKLKKQTSLPLVISEHSSKVNQAEITQDLFNVAEYSYKAADFLIAVSPSLVLEIKNKFNKEAVYIPNTVDLDSFNYDGNMEESEEYHFVATGSLISLKRMDLAIEAFIEAFSKNPLVKLTIFGQGPQRANLEKIIKDNNMEAQIFLKGMTSRQAIAKKYKQANCFVLPSQSETFGVAYIEALAMGLPVIATKCGGPEAFVNKDNGILIDVDSKDQLVAAFKYMYSNSDKFDKNNISANIKSKFSPKVVSDQLKSVYSQVVNKVS